MSPVRLSETEAARAALAALEDGVRIELAEAALRTIADPELAGKLAGAADRITRHAYAVCEQAMLEARRLPARDAENVDPYGPNNPPVGRSAGRGERT